MTSLIIKSLSLLTLISNVFVVLFLAIVPLSRKWEAPKKLLVIKEILKQKGILYAFIVALVATSGSLYFSEGAGFEPCKLCWF